MEQVKQHDWIATLMYNPELDLQGMADYGVTPETAELKSKDYYKNLEIVQKAFTENGEFDEKKYNNFYDSAEQLYTIASQINLVGNILNQYEYSPFNVAAPQGAKIRDVTPTSIKSLNPYKQTIGVLAPGHVGAQELSVDELAQQNKVFNTETGQFENYTPNDLDIFSFIARPTLVLAQ